jgi:hypothetical protein
LIRGFPLRMSGTVDIEDAGAFRSIAAVVNIGQ